MHTHHQPGLANDQSLNHVGVDVMKLRRKLTRLTENARFGTLDVVAMRRCWAPVTIDTPNILAAATGHAGSHAGDETKGRYFSIGGLWTMLMATGVTVRAFVAQEVDVAELHLLHAIDLYLVVVLSRWVDTLSCTVACDNFLAIHGSVDRRLGCHGS
jgi:hypothetical protein